MRRLLVLALLGLIALPAAAVKDPFPNQPGALSAEEIAAATAAMKQAPGSEDLPLVASGKRDLQHMMTGYAVFASPLVDFSKGVKTRRQAWCNYFSAQSAWRCSGAHDEFRATAQGIEHVYSYQVTQGRGDRHATAEIAGYMYSQCFTTHLETLGGKPMVPSQETDYVSVVVDDGKGYNVMTGYQGPGGGTGNMYRLERTDRKADGCGFRMPYARIGATLIPESHAREAEQRDKAERAKALAQERERAAKAPPSAPDERMDAMDIISAVLMWAAWLAGGAAVTVPWGMLAKKRPETVWVSAALSATCTVLAIFAAALVPAKYNIRIDLLISGAIVVMAWMVFAAVAISAATRK